jgi:hypothetical protein
MYGMFGCYHEVYEGMPVVSYADRDGAASSAYFQVVMKLIFSFEEFQMFIMLIFVPESGFERLGFGPSAFISVFATIAIGAMSQSEIYTVFCVVLGEDVRFSVDIVKNETVAIVKDLICKKKRGEAFADVEANFLDLYHVEFADDDKLGTYAEGPLDSTLQATTPLKGENSSFPRKT